MQTANINDILQNILYLPLEDQYFIVETVNKRIHELRRDQIVYRAKEAETNYKTGNITKGTVKDLIREIEND